MEFHISILEDEKRLPELIELFRTGLGETTIEHWKWRLFTDNGLEDRPFAVIAEDEVGRMVAVSSVLPAPYYSTNGVYRCFQFCDWVVHPDFRGQGMIGKLYQFTYDYFKNKNYDFIIEFPNDNSYPIFMKYGFHEEPQITCWRTKTHYLFRIKRAYTDYKFQNTEIRFSESCPFDEHVFETNGRIRRNASYLKWKYEQNPDTEYRWISLWKEKNCTGYFVYTITHGRLHSAVNVYDWEYIETDPILFREVLTQLQKAGHYVSIWGLYNENVRSLFRNTGLCESDGGTRLVMKAVSERGWPESLSLTRIDTDY